MAARLALVREVGRQVEGLVEAAAVLAAVHARVALPPITDKVDWQYTWFS